MSKKIRDPIYDYITIEDEFLPIINSIEFQRLRNIIQTSYTSIYPSALHNRFTHSLGVFWLGNIAFDALIKNSSISIANMTPKDIKDTRCTFIMACLCHDLGHSPFSHTGERFYDAPKISKELMDNISSKAYKEDVKNEKDIVGKQHEIMSALLAIKKFGINIPDHSFFARCIIGLKYKNIKHTTKSEKRRLPLYKACIELLNSNIIDVDKLDYLIRDSYMSGYSSISIDYNRLLNGVFINSGEHPIGYEKSSLSVLENVLTAHDMERRWVQSHPTIQYEGYLLQTIIRELNAIYNDEKAKLFSYNSITSYGEQLKGIGKIRLLSDSDVLFLAKQNFDHSDAVKEYCDRRLRRHPIWKSEAEYSSLFSFKSNDAFIKILMKWETMLLSGKYDVYSLNDDFYNHLELDFKNLEKKYNSIPSSSKKTTIKSNLDTLKVELDILRQIKDYLERVDVPFDLVIVTQEQFKSGLYKPGFQELPIRFYQNSNKISQMKEVSAVPFDLGEDKKTFFYIYYQRTKNRLDALEFSKIIRKAAVI